MVRIKYKEASSLDVERGRPTKGKKPAKSDLKNLYIKESKSIREVAELLGCSKDMVYRSLKNYNIELRKNIRRSVLHNYKISFLENGIKKKGIRGLARELKISESTLRHHMKVRKGEI